MALGPSVTYVPPSVYTRTLSESNIAGLISGLRIPVLVGVGQEELDQKNLEMIRGSSSNLDQQIFRENVSERFVLSEANPSNPTLGPTNGVSAKLKVRNYPIVDGQGFGRISNDARSVLVTVNGLEVAVGSVNGTSGTVTLQVPPQAGDDVRVTYYFRRTDTAFTDDVSTQISVGVAEIVTPAVAPFTVVAGVSDTLVIEVDGITTSVVLTAATYTAAGLKTAIDGKLIAGLGTAVFTDSFGADHLALSAARKIAVGDGNLNGVLGLSKGASSARNTEFRVFQRPVVDGSDGGITTNDTTKVVVLVDGAQVIPVALDGTNGVVTLPMAPASGSKITIQYFANTWQDTFDYLPNTLVTNVVRCGFAVNRSDYIEKQDFVVENPSPDVSVVHWGTSYSVTNTLNTPGSTVFDTTQVLPTLVDDKIYMGSTARYVDTTQVPAIVSDTVFVLPEVPTTGNGRDTTLGQSLYNTVANGRTALNSNRPDLVQVWAGLSVADAKSRAALKVVSVDAASRQITLRDAVPADHTVYATFNYSRISDDQYLLTNKVAGSVGVGQYEVFSVVQDKNLHQVRFGTKSALPQIVQWPRGTEQVPDAFHFGGAPVNEVVTVTFGTEGAKNAKFVSPGAAAYGFYANTSDKARVTFNGVAFAPDLDTAAVGVMVSKHIAVNGTDQVTFVAGINDVLNLKIDNTNVTVTFTAGATTITAVVAAINAAIDLVDGSGSGGVNFTTTAPNTLASFQRIGAAGGDHILKIKSSVVPAALPAGFDATGSVQVLQGTAETLLGLTAFAVAKASPTATIKPATIVGLSAGTFNITSGVTDSLVFSMNGIDYVVTLPAGAAVTTANVVAAINAVSGLSGVASVGTLGNLQKLRLTSNTTGPTSRLVIKTGSANDILGLTAGVESSRTLVSAQEVTNVIMSFAGVLAEGAVYPVSLNGSEYIAFESIKTGAATSSVAFVTGSASAWNVTAGSGIVPGTSGDNGEDASTKFNVTSSHPSGSVGSGYPGQTYTDARTGLRFSVLPSTTTYAPGGLFTLIVSDTWMVNPSVPYLSLSGLETIVTDTVGVGVGDVVMVQTFNPGGLEPEIGGSYYISYRYLKQDFSTKLITQLKTIEANFGVLSSSNRATLASYLTLLNGAVIVGVKQVLKQPNTNEASDQAYIEAFNELRSPLPGFIKPDVVVPLKASTTVYGALLQHVEVASQERNQSERMGIIGFASGTSPTTAQAIARGLSSSRIVAVYPDSAVITLTDELGNDVQNLIDGTFLAAALAGSAVNPTYDVATPYTRRKLVGFKRLPRIMEPTEANQTALAGITVLEDLDTVIRIRQGLTTNMSSVLTRLPTVTQIADYVQQSARNTLDIFIGTKFLASRTNDVELSLRSMFKQLVQAEIVGAYTGVNAYVAADPTILNVEAYYQPVFPLLYIMVTFNLRARI